MNDATTMPTDTPDILSDYRDWAAAQPERISTHSGRCHLWHERCMIHRLAAALHRTREELASANRHMEMAEAAWLRETSGHSPAAVVLTDAEREAITEAAGIMEEVWDKEPGPAMVATLRGLLARTRQPQSNAKKRGET